MADVKISELPAATTPLAGTEQIPLVQGTTTKKVTVDGLFTSANLGTPSAINLTNATYVPVDQATGVLPVNHGGTGTTTPSIVAGTNVTVTGTWPNQTINASGGTITGVTATSPVVSSGGTTPDISMAAAHAVGGWRVVSAGVAGSGAQAAMTTRQAIQHTPRRSSRFVIAPSFRRAARGRRPGRPARNDGASLVAVEGNRKRSYHALMEPPVACRAAPRDGRRTIV